MSNRSKGEAAPIESGAVETAQTDESNVIPMPGSAGEPPDDGSVTAVAADAPEPEPVAPPPTMSEMTGGELAEIKLRSDAVDRAQKDAKAKQDEAFHLARLAQYAQEALTNGLANLINERIGRGLLDPNQQYRIDIERGRIVAAPRSQG